MWAGAVDGMPKVHDSQQKRQFLSCVEMFHTKSRVWIRQSTSGAPPLGVCGYGCTAVGDIHSTSLVVTVSIMVTAIITVFTH